MMDRRTPGLLNYGDAKESSALNRRGDKWRFWGHGWGVGSSFWTNEAFDILSFR